MQRCPQIPSPKGSTWSPGKRSPEVTLGAGWDDEAQRLGPHTDFDRRRADIFAVGEDLHRTVGDDAQTRSLKVLDLLHPDVPDAIDHSKQPQEAQLAQGAYEADIEQAIV